MNIEELRKTLSSEATERCKAQEETIKKLHKELKKQKDKYQDDTDRLKSHIAALGRRCRVLTHGCMCIWCDPEIKKICLGKRDLSVENNG